MSEVRFNWYGDDVKRRVEEELNRNLNRAAIVVKNEVKKSISEPSPPASAPGEPPHKDTGRLRASISHEVKDKTARVGTNLRYGKFLELGTRWIERRPYLRPALERVWDKVKAILQPKL